MPVSSAASRSAAAGRLASPSTWPPGWSQRCTLRWNSTSIRSGGIDHQCRAGQGPVEARPPERVGVGVDEASIAAGRRPAGRRGGRRPPARPRRRRGPAGAPAAGIVGHGSSMVVLSGRRGVVGNEPAPRSVDRHAGCRCGGRAGRPAAAQRRRRAMVTRRSWPPRRAGRCRRGERSMPSAWQSLAGPLHRSRSAGPPAGPAAWRRAPRPGRRPAAGRPRPSPPSPHTTLAHKCMP